MTMNTPPPWRVIIRCYPTGVVEIVDSDAECAREHARLIAAAPDLLAACDAALGYLVMVGTDHGDGIRAILRAAIKKAKGETT